MPEPIRSGIPTTYRGTNFRSRLEARWAAFFDLIGWQWTYEPLDADGYIPDFLIHGPAPLFVEVGPCITRQDYIDKSAKAAAADLAHDILVVGVSPVAPLDLCDAHAFAYDSDLVAGLLGERFADGLGLAAGVWSPCHPSTGSQTVSARRKREREGRSVHRLAVFHATGYFGHRPCADSTYGGHPSTLALTDRSVIDSLWALAGNQVQWRPAA